MHNLKAEPSSVSGCTPIGKNRGSIEQSSQSVASVKPGAMSVGISTGLKDMGLNSVDKSIATSDKDSKTEHMIDRLVASNPLAQSVSPPSVPVTSLVALPDEELPLCIDTSRKALFPLTEDVIQQRNNQPTVPSAADPCSIAKPAGRTSYLKTLVGKDVTSPTKKPRNF